MNFFVLKAIFILSFLFNHSIYAQFVDGDIIESRYSIPFEHISFLSELEQQLMLANGHSDTYYKNGNMHSHEKIYRDMLNNGTLKIRKLNFNIGPHNSSYEYTAIIYGIIGQLIYSEHYIWKNGMLIQVIDNGIVRNIIPGKMRCDFTIIEPSGDSILFHLDSKVNISKLGDFTSFVRSNRPSKYKDSDKYDIIIYHWYFYCKDYETQIKLKMLERKNYRKNECADK